MRDIELAGFEVSQFVMESKTGKGHIITMSDKPMVADIDKKSARLKKKKGVDKDKYG